MSEVLKLLKNNRPSIGTRFRVWFSKLVHPERWSLRSRFLSAAGFLLFLGSISMVVIFGYSLDIFIKEAINDRLDLFTIEIKDRIKNEKRILISEVYAISNMSEVVNFLKNKDRDKLKNYILPYVERLKSTINRNSLYFHFHIPPAQSFLRTWNLTLWGEDLTEIRPMVAKANRDFQLLTGLEIGPGGLVLRAIIPVFDGETHVGSVEAAVKLDEIISGAEVPQNYDIAMLINKKNMSMLAQNMDVSRLDLGDEIAVGFFGATASTRRLPPVHEGYFADRLGSVFYRYMQLDDFTGKKIGGFLLSYDASGQLLNQRDKLIIFSLMFFAGAAALWFILYLNVRRIKDFLSRLRRIITATNSGDFSERFESDNIHCLEILKCEHLNCPVYKNPNLICYLETGSESISPVFRDTCVFLEKYKKCTACPVYSLRHGDELLEAKHEVNTMVRLWSVFISRVDRLLSEVLRGSIGDQSRAASLDTISKYLEYMAALTSFSHDLHGVYDKEEVYAQLSYIFENRFDMKRFIILEINDAEGHMEIAVDRRGSQDFIASDALVNPGICRAKRLAEEVGSEDNPALCPFFNIDHNTLVRCCIPMVMGGQVGAIFSFVFPRKEYPQKREYLNVIRKYINEAAPVLSSLKLLRASKELALNDPLTSCRNRRFLDEYINQYEKVAEREEKTVGFIMADLDFFKKVNDEFGHQAGDAVLKEVANLMRKTIRRADLLIRYGGEEFLVLLHGIKPEESLGIAEKIRAVIEENVFILPDGEGLHRTISLGTAEYPGDAKTLYEAIKYADLALYEAKRTGRNKVVHFQPELWLEEKERQTQSNGQGDSN